MNNNTIYDKIIKRCDNSRILSQLTIHTLEDCCQNTYNTYFGECTNENCSGLAKYSGLLHNFRVRASNCNDFKKKPNVIDYFITYNNNKNSNSNNDNTKNNKRKRKNSSSSSSSSHINNNIKKPKYNNKNTKINNNKIIKKNKKNYSNPAFNGIRYEKNARDKYIEETKLNVLQCGSIVPPKFPWLIVQPDGLIMTADKSEISKLLEIKTPDDLENVQDTTLLNHKAVGSYLQHSMDGSLYLKKSHTYYYQIQISLSILDLNECDFVIYSIQSNEIKIVNVERDDAFCKNMLNNINRKYFEEAMPKLCITCNNANN